MIRPYLLMVACLLLGACASAEGPGSLDRISPDPQTSVQQGQVVAQPGSVVSQNLPAPGTQQPFPQQQFPQTQFPPQQTTLQDFSRIDPRAVPGSDPFADQRNTDFGTSAQTSGQTLQQAVQSGLSQPPSQPLLAPAAPQWPRVALAPISTAPEPQATQLFDAIDDATYRRGMQFVFFGDETAQFVVRSQVSAIPSGQATSLIYVFDVFDARGTLRHRISGAQPIPRSGPDGWALVDQSTTQQVADSVADRLLMWLRSNPA